MLACKQEQVSDKRTMAPPNDETARKFLINASAESVHAIKIAAVRREVIASALVRDILGSWLKKNEKEAV